jgi:hypothetical protein
MGTPGGPLSGSMEAQQSYAIETIRQNQGLQQETQQPQAVQPQEQPSQEQQQPSQADLEAAARQKNLEYNDSVKESRIDEKLAEQALAQQSYYSDMAQELAPKEASSDPQLEQQRAQAIQTEQGR